MATLEAKTNTYPKARSIYVHHVLAEFFEGRSASDEYLCMDLALGVDGKTTRIIKREGSKNPKHVYFLSLGRLGDFDSRDAEAYKVCLPAVFNGKGYYCVPGETNIFSVKIIPLTLEEVEFPWDLELASWRELKILEILAQYVENNINPNLPLLISYGICRNTNRKVFQNKNLIQEMRDWHTIKTLEKKEKKLKANDKRRLSRLKSRTREFSNQSLLVFNELASMDLTHFLRNNAKKMSPDELNSIIFQILAGLVSVHDEGIAHLDLHLSNVLIALVMDASYHYKVEGESYYVPLFERSPRIWDFGRSILKEHGAFSEVSRKAKNTYRSVVASPKAKDEEIIEENLEKNINKYFQYIQSYDVVRICQDIAGETRELSKRKELQPILEKLDRIVDDAFYDIDVNLVSKNAGQPRGKATILIAKYFPEYREFPKNGHVINSHVPFLLTKDSLEKNTSEK